MKTKTFDCVEMKHHGAEQLKKKLDRLTAPQELAFWTERSKELKTRQVTAKAHTEHSGDAPIRTPA